MAQIKIYGIAEHLLSKRDVLSLAIHECVMEVLKLPAEKRAHRFIALDKEDMLYPGDRTDAYTIIEIQMMSGRRVQTRKQLIRRLFDKISAAAGISEQDLEICIIETEPANWGFRGYHGDEVELNYSISI